MVCDAFSICYRIKPANEIFSSCLLVNTSRHAKKLRTILSPIVRGWFQRTDVALALAMNANPI
jgi:hypothetical protein